MWPFKSNKENFVRETFKGFMDESTVNKVIKGELEETAPEKKHIQYILTLVEENEYINSNNLVENIINLALHHQATIESITATYISIIINIPLKIENPRENRISLVKELSDKYGNKLAIVHGECECFVGVFGSKSRMNYTALIPDYKSKLKTLASLEYGKIMEIME